MLRLWSLVRFARFLNPGQPENPHFDPAKPRHTRLGFRNNHPQRPPTAEELARAREEVLRAREQPPRIDLSPVRPDLAFLSRNRAKPSVTWIGHSTVLVQIGGRNILTDPIFSQRASPIPLRGSETAPAARDSAAGSAAYRSGRREADPWRARR